MTYQRIAITGPPGSGKTSFSSLLSKKLNLPIFHLDRYLFLPGDIKRCQADFVKEQQSLVKQDKWIIEGCGTTSLEMRYSEADCVVCINISRCLCIYRCFKRFLFERRKHSDTPDGCSNFFNSELIRYIWNFNRKKTPGV